MLIRHEYLYHYWYFLNKRFRFQSSVCNVSHDMLLMAFGINNLGLSNICGVNYRCIVFGRKDEAIILY